MKLAGTLSTTAKFMASKTVPDWRRLRPKRQSRPCLTSASYTAAQHQGLWLRSPERREYDGLVFRPGRDVSGKFNLWRGFSVKAQQGDSSLFWTLVREAICAGSDEIYAYVR